MSRVRIVGGTITKTTVGDHNIYSDGNIVYSSGKEIRETSDAGISYGEPKDTPAAPVLKQYFEEGWWSSDQEGKARIKDALVGDHVYFHVKTKNIPDGEIVQMKLYEDDNNEKNEPKEKGKKDQDDYKKMINTVTNQEVNSGLVKGNKIVQSILLDNFEKLISEETDKQAELYYRCSYKKENVEFPKSPGDYLKVKEKEPLVIFVNGYYNNSFIQKDVFQFSDGKSLEGYWGAKLKDAATKYLKTAITNVYFLNGADTMTTDGNDRFKNGAVFAKDRLSNKKSKFYQEVFKNKRKILIVSHSMGAAFAEGVVSVLKANKYNIEKVVHLSPADVSDFSVTLPTSTYQIDIDWDPVLMLKNANDNYFINGVLHYGLVQNPGHDHYGHANTKLEGYVWNWFEDLEVINFNYEGIENEIITVPGSGMGYGGTSFDVTYEKYSALNLKHKTVFIKINKNKKRYVYRKNKGLYFVEK
jgi:hypothetical protein